MTTERTIQHTSDWQQVSDWLTAFDESFDYDPVDPAVEHLTHQIARLQRSVEML